MSTVPVRFGLDRRRAVRTPTVPETHIPADDLRVGDVIIHDDGETAVLALDRSKSPTIVTNLGQPDEVSGYLWQRVAVRRD